MLNQPRFRSLSAKFPITITVIAACVGFTIGDNWLVDSGVAAGDRVVVEGLQKIQPGGKVRITETVSQQH